MSVKSAAASNYAVHLGASLSVNMNSQTFPSHGLSSTQPSYFVWVTASGLLLLIIF